MIYNNETSEIYCSYASLMVDECKSLLEYQLCKFETRWDVIFTYTLCITYVNHHGQALNTKNQKERSLKGPNEISKRLVGDGKQL